MAEDEEGDLAAVLARAKLSKHAVKCARYPCGMLPPVVVPCGLGRAVRCGLRFVWCSVGALLCKSCTNDTPPIRLAEAGYVDSEELAEVRGAVTTRAKKAWAPPLAPEV